MITLLTDWVHAWSIAGLSIGVVFVILCLLVLVLMLFNTVAQAGVKPAGAAKADRHADAPSLGEATDMDKVAVAAAVYLYLNNQHDIESDVLTIHHDDHTLWHAELNN